LAADADNEYVMTDSTILRAYRHRAGAKKAGEHQAIGRSSGGSSSKIHTLVDALGNRLDFALSGGIGVECFISQQLSASSRYLPTRTRRW
jgi:hypothetical protein